MGKPWGQGKGVVAERKPGAPAYITLKQNVTVFVALKFMKGNVSCLETSLNSNEAPDKNVINYNNNEIFKWFHLLCLFSYLYSINWSSVVFFS